MAIRLFNTYSRALEEFRPLDPAGGEVTMYTCGPTVYSHAHIGNFRAYLFEDLLQRHLESRGFKLRRVMNITDVDDKTIRGSREAGVPLAEFTGPFKKAFFDDLDTLRMKRADSFPEATDPREIAKMIEMIGTLMEGCTGKKFVRYWLHCAHLMVEGQKMAKSLGNFYTLRDVLAKGYSGREVRYALMRVHYRAPLNFTWEGMEEARQALGRIDDWVRRVGGKGEKGKSGRPT